MMGTAFMSTKECPLKEAAKEALVRSQPDHPQLRHRVLATADPEALAEVMALRDKVPLDKWLRMLEHVNLKERNWKEATDLLADDSVTGRSESEWSRLGSLAVAVIDRIPTAKEFIDSIIREAEELLDSWQFLKTR